MAETDWSGHPGEPDWQELFSAHVAIKYMRGSETVVAARLTARQPAILTMRNSTSRQAVGPSDRVVDARTGEIFNIREKPRRTVDRLWLEVMIEAGASDGR